MDNKNSIIGRIRAFNRFYTVFNRFYTGVGGAKGMDVVKFHFSYIESSILYEFSTVESCTSNELVEKLRIDKGYVSRIIKSFEKKGLITKTVSEEDRRSYRLKLTSKGMNEYEQMNQMIIQDYSALIEKLSDEEWAEVRDAMDTITNKLSKTLV